MAYYGRGDYYGVGDYYGDPLFPAIGALLKIGGAKLLPKAGKLIGRILPGARKTVQVARRITESPAARIIGGAAGAGAGFEVGGRIVRGKRQPTFEASRAAAREAIGFRRRRINYGNTRALVRAGRRMRGFAKLARMAIRFTSPKPAIGRPIFRKKKGR